MSNPEPDTLPPGCDLELDYAPPLTEPEARREMVRQSNHHRGGEAKSRVGVPDCFTGSAPTPTIVFEEIPGASIAKTG